MAGETELRALIAKWRREGRLRHIRPPGAKVTLSDVNMALRRESEVKLECADELEAALADHAVGGAPEPEGRHAPGCMASWDRRNPCSCGARRREALPGIVPPPPPAQEK